MNNTMVREIRGAKINPKSSFKNQGAQNTRGRKLREQIRYLFSNTTSYSTFYAFFSSFRITLWPMWLANSKRQPCFYLPYTLAQEDTQN
jgi:hypothetical protein